MGTDDHDASREATPGEMALPSAAGEPEAPSPAATYGKAEADGTPSAPSTVPVVTFLPQDGSDYGPIGLCLIDASLRETLRDAFGTVLRRDNDTVSRLLTSANDNVPTDLGYGRDPVALRFENDTIVLWVDADEQLQGAVVADGDGDAAPAVRSFIDTEIEHRLPEGIRPTLLTGSDRRALLVFAAALTADLHGVFARWLSVGDDGSLQSSPAEQIAEIPSTAKSIGAAFSAAGHELIVSWQSAEDSGAPAATHEIIAPLPGAATAQADAFEPVGQASEPTTGHATHSLGQPTLATTADADTSETVKATTEKIAAENTASDHQYLDVVRGTDGDDVLAGTLHGQLIDGGAGVDRVVYQASKYDVSVTPNGDGSFTVVDSEGRDIGDRLVDVEIIRFEDGDLDIESIIHVRVGGSASDVPLPPEQWVIALDDGEFAIIWIESDVDGRSAELIQIFDSTNRPMSEAVALEIPLVDVADLPPPVSTTGAEAVADVEITSDASPEDAVLSSPPVEMAIATEAAELPVAAVEDQRTTSYLGTPLIDQQSTSMPGPEQAPIGSDPAERNIAVSISAPELQSLPGSAAEIIAILPEVVAAAPANDAVVVTGPVLLKIDGREVAVVANAGDDRAVGSSAGDIMDGGAGDDVLLGRGGDDVLIGGTGNDYLAGGAGDDVIIAGTGADTLQGGDGDDVLSGGFGRDEIDGGRGNDTISFQGELAGIRVDLSAGTSQRSQSNAMPVGLAPIEDLVVSVENVVGGLGDDDLIGNDDDNILAGSAADDRLEGRGGEDTLDGGSGFDTAFYRGLLSEYRITLQSDGVIEVRDLVDDRDGKDDLYDVESISFSDQTVLAADAVHADGQSQHGSSNADIQPEQTAADPTASSIDAVIDHHDSGDQDDDDQDDEHRGGTGREDSGGDSDGHGDDDARWSEGGDDPWDFDFSNSSHNDGGGTVQVPTADVGGSTSLSIVGTSSLSEGTSNADRHSGANETVDRSGPSGSSLSEVSGNSDVSAQVWFDALKRFFHDSLDFAETSEAAAHQVAENYDALAGAFGFDTLVFALEYGGDSDRDHQDTVHTAFDLDGLEDYADHLQDAIEQLQRAQPLPDDFLSKTFPNLGHIDVPFL